MLSPTWNTASPSPHRLARTVSLTPSKSAIDRPPLCPSRHRSRLRVAAGPGPISGWAPSSALSVHAPCAARHPCFCLRENPTKTDERATNKSGKQQVVKKTKPATEAHERLRAVVTMNWPSLGPERPIRLNARAHAACNCSCSPTRHHASRVRSVPCIAACSRCCRADPCDNLRRI